MMRARLGPLVLAALAGCSAPALEPGARPVEIALPDLPPVEPDAAPNAPAPGSLGRDAALADRFTTQGQSVRYAFAMRAGELAIFDLGCFGNARGWRATARVRILAPDGAECAALEREGPVVQHVVTCFAAPADGEYVYELTAARSFFRYRLVRRSGFRDRELGACEDLGARTSVVGFLKSGDDRARYRLPVAAGEEVAVKVVNHDEEGRVERRTPTPRRPYDGVYAGMLYQGFELELLADGRALAPKGRFARVRADAAGELEVEVLGTFRGDGGLFELEIERDPVKVAVRGLVLDAADAPVPGASLVFQRGPDRDAWSAVVTRADGSFDCELPPGAYRIALSKDGSACEVAANLLEAREINLILPGAAAVPAESAAQMQAMRQN